VKRLQWLIAVPLAAACMPSGTSTVPRRTTPWSDPEHRLTVFFPGEPTPRAAQELNGMGTINYQVYAFDDAEHNASYRACAFHYPDAVPGLTSFDPAGELEHASGVQVARMGGDVRTVTHVLVDGLDGTEIVFGVRGDGGEAGVGVLRMLIGTSPPARFEAWCITTEENEASCTAFVQSLHPSPNGSVRPG